MCPCSVNLPFFSSYNYSINCGSFAPTLVYFTPICSKWRPKKLSCLATYACNKQPRTQLHANLAKRGVIRGKRNDPKPQFYARVTPAWYWLSSPQLNTIEVLNCHLQISLSSLSKDNAAPTIKLGTHWLISTKLQQNAKSIYFETFSWARWTRHANSSNTLILAKRNCTILCELFRLHQLCRFSEFTGAISVRLNAHDEFLSP